MMGVSPEQAVVALESWGADAVGGNCGNFFFFKEAATPEIYTAQYTLSLHDALPISTEFRNSRNILFANYHGYRVTRSIKPMDAAVKLYNSTDIRFRNVHVNAESGFASCDDKGCGTYTRASKFPFENAILDVTSGQEVREREFARLDFVATPPAPLPVSPGV